MWQLRPSMSTVIGVIALLALVVPPAVMADGLGTSVRSQVIRAAAAPVGGAVTKQELPGCSNPSEPFVGRSQGCDSGWSVGDWAISNGTTWGRLALASARPNDAVIFDPVLFSRGPRQTTSLDGSVNPETGALSRRGGTGGLTITERGPDLSADPTYNSTLASTPGPMGYGWSFPYSMSLRIYRGTATITQEDGSMVVFKRGSDGQFHAPPRVIAALTQTSAGSYTLTRGSSRSTCPSYLLQSCESFTFSKGHLSRISSGSGRCKSSETCGNGYIDVGESAGRPVSATSNSGDSLTFGYTAGHITSIAGPGGVSEYFTYDSSGNLASATDPNGNKTQYGYDKHHRLTRVHVPLGRTTVYEYNSSGRVTAVTDPLGHTTSYEYSASNHTTTITSPEGRRVVLSFQAGELVDVAEGPGAPPLAQWTFAYSPITLDGTKSVDPDGRVTTMTSDGDGMPLSVTDALGHTTTFAYSDTGRRSSITDPMGVTTKFTYDENGNVLTQSTPVTAGGAKQIQTYSFEHGDLQHPGDLTSSIDPLGNETDYTYDSRGLPATVTDPLGNTWTYAFKKACFKKTDPRVARLGGGSTPDVTITDPLGHITTYTCDANGNLLTVTDATGATTTNTYNADNELVSTTDPVGRKTTYSYDADGRLIAVHQPDGTTSSATYGADGELLTTVDPAGGTQSFTYDPLGRLTSSTDQLSRKTTYAYDAAGNLTSSTDAKGITATNTYDGDNQLLSTDYSDGVTPPVSYTYNADGRRTSMTDGTGTTTYQYDSLGQLTRSVDGSGASVASSYDLAGDRTALQYPNGHTVTMQYDGDGQMTAVSDWLGNTTHFTYDAAGEHTAASRNGGSNINWVFNGGGRILHITMTDANGVPDASFDYTRAADGRITSVHSAGVSQPTQIYSYDARGRLGAEDSYPLSFDSRDNLTSLPDGSKLSYDAADQLLSSQAGGLATSYTFNADGERTGASSAVRSLSYTWSCVGCLASFTDNGTTTTYALNGDGERMSSSGGGVTHTFTWDSAAEVGHNFGMTHDAGGASPYARGIVTTKPGSTGGTTTGCFARGIITVKAGSGTTGGSSCGRGIVTTKPSGGTASGTGRLLSDGTNSYVYGPDGLPIEQIDNAGNALFLDEDAQGSVRLLTDAAGNVKGTASYDAFGNETVQNGASSPFGFDGMYLDSESGLYAMSGGVYDPATGQTLAKETENTSKCKINVCGDGAQASSRYTGDSHICTAARCGDGFDESCQGNDTLCTLSPYAAGGGDPVNGTVIGNVVGASAVMTNTGR